MLQGEARGKATCSSGGGNIEPHLQQRRVEHRSIFGLPTATDAGRQPGRARRADLAVGARSDRRCSSTTRGRSAALTLNAGVRYDRYHGWLPEQEQLGGDGRAGRRSAAKTFAETRLLHVERRSRRASA